MNVGIQPALIVTVDVEGDDIWSRPRTVTTDNAACLPRFHELCQRHRLRPVYLATAEMAVCPEFQRFAREVIREGDGELGMHLHAWSSPPDAPLDSHDHHRQPFVTEFPPHVARAKMTHLTRLLEDTFQVPILSHRGGRWAFDEVSARILAELGYLVDASVTPLVNWNRATDGGRAPDYSDFPSVPYFLDLDAVGQPGDSGLLEVPMTTCRVDLDGPAGRPGPAPFVVRWLRPNGRNLKVLRHVTARAFEERRPCLVLMLHSSELMAGGSPGLPLAADIAALYRDLDAFFAETSARCRPMTLAEFHADATARRNQPTSGEG